MELTKDERLIVMEGINKILNDKKAGLLTEAKAEARSELLELHETMGVDRRALMSGNTKLGEVGISYSKAKPFIFGERKEEALAFLLENELAEITPKRGWEEHFARSADGGIFLTDTGEFVDWAGWDEGGAKSASIRGCNPDEILNAMGNKLIGQDINKLLLEG